MVAGANDGGGQLVRDLLKRIRDAAPLLETDRQAYGKAVETITEVARKALGVMGEFELNISSNRIMMGDDDEVYKSEARTNNLAFDLFRQGLRRLTFRPGLDLDEVEGFVRRFAECRSAEQIDEDFVTMMWQDSSSHIEIIAIDMFTEKIFMSEAEFIKQFREVLDDVAPGLIEMDDDEESGVDKAERPLHILTHHGDVDRADIEQRKIRKALTADQDGLAVSLMPDEEIVDTTHHLLHLAACQILSERSVLSNAEFQGIWVRLLTSYLEEQNWQGYADAMRSISALLDLGRAFSPDVAERFDKLRKVILGRDMAEQIADHILPENTQFFSWSRWLFHDAGELTAPTILELVNGCKNSGGRDWLKDLLRRQGTSSLDPWAERMRDPNPGIVLEVIDVIVGSGLAGQAKGLLLDTLKHADGGVRARCIESLTQGYDTETREALLPLLKDPEPQVRKAVLTRFVSAEDRSVVTYLTHILKSGEFFALSEDEQRELMEAVVHLSGERHIDLIVDKLNITEQSGISKLMRRANDAITDNITRRAAISALALMSTPKANAVIRDVKARSDLSLAAHCDVVLRLSQRDRSQQSSSADQKSDAPAFLEDISLGASRMGQAFVFTLDALGFDDVDGLKEQADARRMQGHDSSRVRDVAQAADSPEQAVELVVDDAAQLADLGPNPLLGHHVVLDNWDRVKLVVRPAILEGERYTIVDAEASLVGVNQENIAVHVRRPTSLPPVRIVERSRVPKASPPPPEPVDSLLQAYLEGDVAENEPVETDDKRNLSELLNDYLDEPMTDTSPVKPGASAFPDAPPPQILAPETRVTSDSLGGANVPDSDEVSADSQHAELDDLLASYIDSGEDK